MKCRALFNKTIASSKVLQDTKAEGNIPYLDGIRTIAAVTVFAAHLFPSNIYTLNHLRRYVDAQAGVDLFFVLSAYLLTMGFLKSSNRFSAAILAQYFKRRVARILPLFYTVLIMFFVAVGWQNKYGLREPITWDTFLDFIKLATFTNNLDLKQTRPEMTFNGPMWSIAPEVHFYILLPFILAYIIGGGG